MEEFGVEQVNMADGCVVKIAGKMTIQNAQEIRSSLLEAFSCAEKVTCNLDKVTDIDLSGLQLLCAAHRTSVASGKHFVACGMANELVKSIAVIAGFPRHVGCVEDVEKTCIWVGGKN